MQRLRLSKLFVELRWHPSPVLIRMILWELGLPVAAHLIPQLQHALKHPELMIMQIRLRTGDWQFYDMSKVYKSIISNNKRGFMDFGRVEPNWQAWQAFLYPHHHTSPRPVSGKDAGNLNNHKNNPKTVLELTLARFQGFLQRIPGILQQNTWEKNWYNLLHDTIHTVHMVFVLQTHLQNWKHIPPLLQKCTGCCLILCLQCCFCSLC